MRRLLVLFLLVLLPLSASFAATASYCPHEETVAHQHDVRAAGQNIGDARPHADCSHCHPAGLGITSSSFAHLMPRSSGFAPAAGDDRFTSASADTLERPPAAMHN